MVGESYKFSCLTWLKNILKASSMVGENFESKCLSLLRKHTKFIHYGRRKIYLSKLALKYLYLNHPPQNPDFFHNHFCEYIIFSDFAFKS